MALSWIERAVGLQSPGSQLLIDLLARQEHVFFEMAEVLFGASAMKMLRFMDLLTCGTFAADAEELWPASATSIKALERTSKSGLIGAWRTPKRVSAMAELVFELTKLEKEMERIYGQA